MIFRIINHHQPSLTAQFYRHQKNGMGSDGTHHGSPEGRLSPRQPSPGLSWGKGQKKWRDVSWKIHEHPIFFVFFDMVI